MLFCLITLKIYYLGFQLLIDCGYETHNYWEVWEPGMQL